MPSVYPALPGLTYSVIKRPTFYNAKSQAVSGRQVVIGYGDYPLWEFELTYDYLPDFQGAGLSASDLKYLMGFFLSTQGNLYGFNFEDPDDNAVVGQNLGIGDGVTRDFILRRTYGNPAAEGSEPVGYINVSQPFAAYIDGVLVPDTDYILNQTTPVNQIITFDVAPGVGDIVTASFSYYYYVRFKDPTLDFEKFMALLWSASKVVLASQRGF